jgi:hypothetical protein
VLIDLADIHREYVMGTETVRALDGITIAVD